MKCRQTPTNMDNDNEVLLSFLCVLSVINTEYIMCIIDLIFMCVLLIVDCCCCTDMTQVTSSLNSDGRLSQQMKSETTPNTDKLSPEKVTRCTTCNVHFYCLVKFLIYRDPTTKFSPVIKGSLVWNAAVTAAIEQQLANLSLVVTTIWISNYWHWDGAKRQHMLTIVANR